MNARTRILGALELYRQERNRRSRQLPPIIMHSFSGAPAIYYVAPDENRPSGGVRVIYRHVDMLNALGIPAAVVHPREDFRCSWFDNSTRVISMNALRLREVDLLVVPEFYASGLAAIPSRARVVVFNQGPHHTFDLIPLRQSLPGWPYSEIARLEGILTVSQDGAELLRLAFPRVHVGIARNVVDRCIFHPSGESRGKLLSFVPSRRSDELQELLHFLNAWAEIRTHEWEIIPLTGLPERGMADALRGSSIFLSLSDRDGFGLPPAEAMACASYVVGYHGGGGREFFDPAYCSPVASTTELLSALEEAMNSPESWRRERGEKASARILGHYTAEGLKSDLERFYGGLL
jgi:hypothetical protein